MSDISESILTSIKKSRGLAEEYDVFDDVIIQNINTAFFALWQLGVGIDPSQPFRITGADEVWSDFIEPGKVETCKDYISLRVQLLFDPPTSSFLLDNINAQLREFEWRMTVGMDEYNNS